jgi:hypothetical protein
MIKRLALFILLACCASFAQTTTFTANLKDLIGNIPGAYVELSLKNCAGSGTTPTIPHVNGVGVISFPVQLYPNVSTGLVTGSPYDETGIVCGSSTGVAYYHIAIYQGDATRSLVKKLLFADDFDVQGASFNLNSATPRSGSVITPPVATAVLTNPAGNQTIVQPAGTALSINHLSATFAQNANGADMIPANRFTDTSPTGNFLNFKNAALTTPLWQVDVTGTLTAGIIPNARLVTPAAGTGPCTNQFVRTLNSGAAPTCSTVGSSDLASSLALVTPNIGAATGTSYQGPVGNITPNTGAFTTLSATGTSTVADVNLGAANTLRTSNVKQVSATTAFCISDNAGICHFFIASTSPFVNTFIQGNGSGNIFLGSAAKTSVDDLTGNITMSGSTSGTTVVKPSAVASGTLTLPAATGTLSCNSCAQTLTATVLSSPAFTGTETGMSITSPAMTSPTVNTGVSQGSGMKHQRFGATNATTATAGATSLTTYTWTNAFADANYTVVCTGHTQSSTPGGVSVESVTASNFAVRVTAITAAASSFATVDCIAMHD